MKWIREHFKRHQQREFWDFCWRTTLESLFISLLAAFFLLSFISEPERELPVDNVGELFFFIVVFAPVTETFLFQAIPISIARQYHGSFKTQLVISIFPFFMAHVIEGLGVGVAAGLVGGFYLAFTYATWVNKSTPGKAFLATVVCHAMGNGICFLLIFWDFVG